MSREARSSSLTACLGIVAAVGAVAAALSLTDGAMLLRHLYLVPIVWSAWRFGPAAGSSTAVLAVVLDAPRVLSRIEAYGLDPQTTEALVTFGLLPAVGGLTGVLVELGRRRAARYRAALALQRAFGDGRRLPQALALANDVLSRYIDGVVEVVVRRGDGFVGQDGDCTLRGDSIGADVVVHGQPRYVADVPPREPGRPRRLFVVPLVAAGQVVGLVAACRRGDLSREERTALETFGVVIGLALENARLGDELEERVAAATRRLEELDRAKSDFVATASHELRTPLTALLGFSELLLTRSVPAERARSYLALIHREAERLTRIVDDLLDLSRIETGQRSDLQLSACDVVSAVAMNLDLFRAQNPGHRWEMSRCADVGPALADPDALDRIVKNLLSNAAKYSPPGGQVRLDVAADDAEVALSVEDDGPGIPDEARPHVFERYYRVPGRSRTVRGLGLGLALVKSLVDAQEGTVRVERARGGGSRFIVTLPRARKAVVP